MNSIHQPKLRILHVFILKVLPFFKIRIAQYFFYGILSRFKHFLNILLINTFFYAIAYFRELGATLPNRQLKAT